MSHPHRREPSRPARLCVLTVSDTRTAATDVSGAQLRDRLEGDGHAVIDYRIVPDEPQQVADTIRGWCAIDDCDGVLINGGTGIAPRDRTYEAVDRLLDRRLDGFGELFRALSFEQIGSAAMLSRAVAGIHRGRLVFSLPGSPPAVELAMTRLILPEIGHLLQQLGRVSS